mgnify:CR=1 FL=1
MRRASTGLRARLLLLVLAAVIPAFGLIGYTAIAQRQEAAQNAEKDAMNLVRLAAREQSQLIASTRQLLVSLAQLPAIRAPGDATCSRVLAELLRPYPYYTNFGVATPDGRVFCSALPLTQPVNIADRSYFRRAVQSGDFGLGNYQIGRITGIPAINFGYPVKSAGGNVRAVVYAALNLSWLNQLAAGIELPVGSALTVVDSRGTILTRHPEPERWVGKPMRETPLIKEVLGHHGEGTAELDGLDGVTRLYAFAPLHDGPAGSAYVSVGIPKEVAFASANRAFTRNMASLLVVALLALAAAWVGSDVFVLRRVQALASAARRLATGDLTARTGLPHGSEELGQLARNFDDMAYALERLNRALKTLSAGNRALLRIDNEPDLLREMCRVAVEVGGYRMAWVGYVEHDEAKSIRPVAHAGFEEGHLATLKLTWADTERGQGPGGTAVRTGKPCAVRHIDTDPGFAPWREEALKRGYRSIICLPLRVHGDIIGILCVLAAETDAFGEQEAYVLEEMADDLAFGIATLRDRERRREAERAVERMAYYDSLTGLPNHVQFEERLQQALSDAGMRGQNLALLLLDLDRFREINDALGFSQGDLLLKDVGARIRDAVGAEGLVARMRGDEFAVLLPSGDADHAAETARRILAALEAPFVLSDITLDASAAIGIALAPQHGGDITGLIRHVDVAMRQAKKSGEHYAFYAPEHDEDSSRRLVLARELRHAIEEDELTLYYQPKIDMRQNAVCGAEALVRWIHPQQGMMPPDEFIPLAEHTGLIKPLTDWVLAAALRQSSAWRQEGLVLPIAVNLSARNLREAGLLNKMKQLFLAWGASAEWLELEITESAIMDDPEGALKTLTGLNDLGIALFIDDFGTGYSSLGYLQRLPVDAVKIDKSFVKGMLANVDSESIVRATITLAHDLGIKVVAEGVENQEMWDRLAELRCDVAQGYFIGKPMPAEEFQAWLAQTPWRPEEGGGHQARPPAHRQRRSAGGRRR